MQARLDRPRRDVFALGHLSLAHAKVVALHDYGPLDGRQLLQGRPHPAPLVGLVHVPFRSRPGLREARQELVESVKKGVSKAETARRFGVDRATVKRYCEGNLLVRKL